MLLGNGNGTFQNAAVYALPPFAYAPYSIDKGDFNRDSRVDLVTANYNSGNASVLLGNGDGTFRQNANYTTDAYSRGVAVDDFDRNGWPDFVTVNVNGGDISVLLNDQNWYGAAPSTLPRGSQPAQAVNEYPAIGANLLPSGPSVDAGAKPIVPIIPAPLFNSEAVLDALSIDQFFVVSRKKKDAEPLLASQRERGKRFGDGFPDVVR